jgi:lipoprotein-anchoring transpeptidase ErfK/SrfK
MGAGHLIEINLREQILVVLNGAERVAKFRVSTAANGPGEQMDSECTPRGRHVIDETIGADCVENTVFVGRRPTGEIYHRDLRDRHPGRDWIVTRILWLRGIEAGRNDGGRLDSKARYIYIHGTPDDTDMGAPGSRGCIRMRNADVVRLFDLVEVGTPVNIIEA